MRRTKSILIIDDDPDMRTYLRKILEGMGHEIHDASNSKEAEKILSQVYPHLILLDINLENEIGFHFISQVRMIDPYKRIKIIMISSLSSKKAIDLSQRTGTNGYLIKPINNNVLISTIKKLMPELELRESIIFDNSDSGFMAKCYAQITKISEIALIVRSKMKFTEKGKLEINARVLQKFEIDRAQFVVHEPSKDVSPGVYDTKVNMLGLNESDLKVIRKMKTKKL